MVAAPITLFLGRGILPWAWATAISWLTFVIAILLSAQVAELQTVNYFLGSWPPPFGIEYRVDGLSAVVLLIVTGAASVVAPYALESVRKEIEPQNQGLFYTLFLLCLAGLLGVTITGDAFNVFVFLEVASLSTYVLVALGGTRDRRGFTAAYTYLVMGTIGATFFVIGVGLAYMVTGTLNMDDMAKLLPGMAENRTVAVAFAFIVVGMGLKLALFPIHLWLPNAYTFAPSVVSAFLAGTSTKVALYVLLRFLFTVFGLEFDFQALVQGIALMPLAIAGMFIASAVAIWQVDVKRLLAYSSVAQVGYIVLGISLASSAGVAAAVLHMTNHAMMKIALFLVMGVVMYRIGSTKISAFEGLGKTMPWTMAAFVIGGLSLIGVPGTVGFISKWALLGAAFDQGLWWLALLIVLSSLLAVLYVWRVVEIAYLSDPPATQPDVQVPLMMTGPMWFLVLANIYFGLDASGLTNLANRAAVALTGAAP